MAKPVLALVLPPVHLMAWGALVGTDLYQTFINTKLCYNHLPMAQFTNLTKRIFPVYFAIQLGLSVVTILSVPPYGPLAAFMTGSKIPVWTSWVPLAVSVACAVWNVFVWGPRASVLMIERVHQQTRDGPKKSAEGGLKPVSEEMRLLNKAFSRAHAMTIHLNLVSVVATVAYGFVLAGRMSFA